ncbi:MAG: sensor histidine kinase, partial [Clostridiales bacterium]|nr:sensor histidine kinase [Clostridiales bacterium]
SCIIILSVLSILISIDFINPINRLVKGMNTVQGGHNSVRIDVDRGDELGYLSRTFNDMAEEINHLVTWKYSEEITRKEAELKALQSQINPHFLFNTLESINWMAQLNNVPEISNTVTALSSIMEAGIGRDDRLITVREEFCYIDNYIMILKNRYEDRIELYKDVREEALAIMIPRLLIQPLVENAVYHGIEKIRGKGVIWLKALTDGQDMKIIVEDNGPGIEQGELDIINERLAVDNETYFKNLQTRKNKSIGLDNVNRRIKLFYGEEYGLKIESRQSSEYWLGVERRRTGDTSAVVTEQPDERRQASYTRVVVTIPLRQDGKSGMGTEAAEV